MKNIQWASMTGDNVNVDAAVRAFPLSETSNVGYASLHTVN